ncbi:exodeoxyribonuclease V subunit gamma [Angustibacter sp. McL0619]|uniref:exodeoxyribonuclease V subunit gamma n=1 Tax=Angustibacter sp. McL0619 TaxID=3415676 RepID=UPI003CF832F4
MLLVHRSERADVLVGPLAALLGVPMEDPFIPDVIAVPTRGVERWLAQRLSHHLGAGPDGEAGVCAAVDFGSPGRLVSGVLSRVLGVDPDDDPWRAEALSWPLLEVIDACAGEPWSAALNRHVGADTHDELRRGRRLGVARHIARLFAGYGAQRPAMLLAWAADRDEDGGGQPVPADLAWQPQLWRRVRAHLGVPSPAERLDEAVRLLGGSAAAVDLPARLSVFGPTRLPTDQLLVLHALSRHRDVHLWLAHPSPALWQKVSATSSPSPMSPRRGRPVVAAHPMLGSMARDATELQLRLTALGVDQDVMFAGPPPPASLLGALQRSLRDDTATDPNQVPPAVAAADRSVQVHACHGRSRQVEVLREVLVGMFADDPTLEPRDVVVMCPDVEAYAPLVGATFGLAPDVDQPSTPVHPGHLLRVRLADRSLRQTNPVLSLIASLLSLADGRVSASEVLDLAATAPVRRRFGFADDDLAQIRRWSVAAGVHWGEDLARRARFGLPELRQGTWDTALDRILLGVAMADEHERFVGPAIPLDDVDSTDIELAGRLAELVERVTAVLAALDGAQPVGAWLDHLDAAIDLLADTAVADGWQVVQARRVLAQARQSTQGRDLLPIRLPDVRSLLADRLAGRPSRSGFRTGALTVCSLEPMRAVPHRVVCLLGLDDGTFPRGTSSDGDDLLLRDPWVGERDRRGEDRQLFLDAVSAAGEHLVVLYSGADERTGAARPPAVPVSELLDALDGVATGPGGGSLRDHVVVRHPLQTVDERNFTAGALGRRGPFSFDATGYRAAIAGRGERAGRVEFLSRPLPKLARPDEVDLDDLVRMLEHPVKWFARQRLQLSVVTDEDEVDDRLPLQLDGLQSWGIGDRLLTARLAGVDPGLALAAEWRRGQVPPKELGRATLQDVAGRVEPIAQAARRYAVGAPRVVDVRADLPSGVVVNGSVPEVHDDLVVRTVYSRLGAKHRLRAWVQLLALVASEPDVPWRAVTIGRAPTRVPSAAVVAIRTPSAPWAVQRLEDLVRLRDRAIREPLPMPVDTAHAYARSRHGGDAEVQALESARHTWQDGFEADDEYHVLCWGEQASLGDLLGTPDATEQAWWPQDSSRLGVLARRVWDPLLDHESTVTP